MPWLHFLCGFNTAFNCLSARLCELASGFHFLKLRDISHFLLFHFQVGIIFGLNAQVILPCLIWETKIKTIV